MELNTRNCGFNLSPGSNTFTHTDTLNLNNTMNCGALFTTLLHTDFITCQQEHLSTANVASESR